MALYYEAAMPADHGMINIKDIATHAYRWLVGDFLVISEL